MWEHSSLLRACFWLQPSSPATYPHVVLHPSIRPRRFAPSSHCATSVQTQCSSFTNQIGSRRLHPSYASDGPESADFILTDPPYLVNYRDRSNRTIQNDSNAAWLKPAMREAYRVLKQDRVAIMFYGWTRVDAFFEAWKEAGFQPVGPWCSRSSNARRGASFTISTSRHICWPKGVPRCRSNHSAM
jgi:hypothetical protein